MTEDIQVSSRKPQFIIGRSKALLPAGAEPLNIHLLKQYIERASDMDLVKVLEPRGLATALSREDTHPEAILVAQMTEERARELKQAGGDQLLVEVNARLTYAKPSAYPQSVTLPDSAVLVPNKLSCTIPVVVKGERDQAVAGAHVYLFGQRSFTQGVTGDDGSVTLTLFGETGDDLQGLRVDPIADYWSLWVPNPALAPDKNNIVMLRAFSQDFDNFPNQQCVGWGQQAMNLNRLPGNYTGKGAKIAVIDSGGATSHHDLQGQIADGYDFVNQQADSWNQDEVFHGTHCTGIIAGKNDNFGIRGFAPEAEVHEFKILPGGRFSDLIDALERCIELQIDVVNLSIGTSQRSLLVEQSLQKAREQGVACIVAAGNSGGPVLYPASSPQVLTVAAIGKRGTFPENSYHSTQVFTGHGPSFTPDGYFSAQFTCFGPEVGVCAPGVAILSCVPPNNFAAWDGTSMATPHVTGLAALLLAHHPDFLGPYAMHNSQRVQRLFSILKQSSRHLDLGDPRRVGAGLPDAMVAFNLAPAPAVAGPSPSDIGQHLWNEIQKILYPSVTAPVAHPVERENMDTALQDLETLIRQAGLV
ncbi:MAG TPA: S8 family serine peptidase [Ktedonobacteraceae bacterium]|nr:S8 family serine peptidase [Ktedonobacteraceae bacterium]